MSGERQVPLNEFQGFGKIEGYCERCGRRGSVVFAGDSERGEGFICADGNGCVERSCPDCIHGLADHRKASKGAGCRECDCGMDSELATAPNSVRHRLALNLIAERGGINRCENYTGNRTCRSAGSGRTLHGEDHASQWCDACVADDALGADRPVPASGERDAFGDLEAILTHVDPGGWGYRVTAWGGHPNDWDDVLQRMANAAEPEGPLPDLCVLPDGHKGDCDMRAFRFGHTALAGQARHAYVEAKVRAIDALRVGWLRPGLDEPRTAHADHAYDGCCAVCRFSDQPSARLAVIAALMPADPFAIVMEPVPSEPTPPPKWGSSEGLAALWRIAPPDTARLRRMFPIKNDTGAFLHNVADWIDAAARLRSVEVACGLNPGEIVCAPNKLDDSSQWECEGHPGDWWPADRMGMPDRRVICRPRSDRGQG